MSIPCPSIFFACFIIYIFFPLFFFCEWTENVSVGARWMVADDDDDSRRTCNNARRVQALPALRGTTKRTNYVCNCRLCVVCDLCVDSFRCRAFEPVQGKCNIYISRSGGSGLHHHCVVASRRAENSMQSKTCRWGGEEEETWMMMIIVAPLVCIFSFRANTISD